MLTEQERQQIAKKGISEEQLQEQLKSFEKGFPFLRLQAAASTSNGIIAPTAEEQARVPHYFVGTLGLTDYYSAARYEEEVMALLAEHFKAHDVAVLTGGSMMYIDAVCDGIDDIPTVDEHTRALMMERYHREGLEALAAELRLLDPEYYAQCDIRNPKRVIHAMNSDLNHAHRNCSAVMPW